MERKLYSYCGTRWIIKSSMMLKSKHRCVFSFSTPETVRVLWLHDRCVLCCCVSQGDRNTWKFILHFDRKKKSKRGEPYKNIQNGQSNYEQRYQINRCAPFRFWQRARAGIRLWLSDRITTWHTDWLPDGQWDGGTVEQWDGETVRQWDREIDWVTAWVADWISE